MDLRLALGGLAEALAMRIFDRFHADDPAHERAVRSQLRRIHYVLFSETFRDAPHPKYRRSRPQGGISLACSGMTKR
jgi:hypothetical protein